MISAFYIRKKIQENKDLENSFLKKVQQIDKDVFRFSFTRKDLLVKIGKGFVITEERISGEPSNTAMFLRKRLKNKKLLALKQHDLDRVLILEFPEYYLIFEFFGKGDMLLTDKEFNILFSFAGKKGKYSFPEPRGYNPEIITLEEFRTVFTEEDIVRSMARNINLPGKYIEYLCKSLNIDPNKEKPDEKEIELLYYGMKNMIENPPENLESEFSIEVEEKQKEEKLPDYASLAEEYKKIGDWITCNARVINQMIEAFKKKDFKKIEELGGKVKDGKIIIQLETHQQQ